ncbi:MAG: ABC transporter ATP-binding protein [Gemmatimonadota bacterium]
MSGGDALLEVRDLRTGFRTDAGEAQAVDGISFRVGRGEALGLVGESGSGKTVTALSILRLVPEPPGRIEPGSSIRYDGRELLALDESAMRNVRGNDVAMVFQEPMSSLNPVFTAGDQVAEAVRLHRRAGRADAWRRAVEMLALVGLPAPAETAHAYPHQLSGGQRQRVMIAMALACDPGLLIADEPTTALDVTIQAQILELLGDLQRRLGMALLLITHDLGVVARVADRVAVMYGGRIVEAGAARRVLDHPRHPYTQGLLRAMPRIDAPTHRLDVIPGQVPAATAWPGGCRFHPRCGRAWEHCRETEPDLFAVDGGGASRCWLERHPERR